MSADEKAQEITRQEYKEWLESRVTQFVAGTLAQMRVSHADHLCQGHTLAKDAERSTDWEVGYIQGISEFLNIKYDDEDNKTVSSYEH